MIGTQGAGFARCPATRDHGPPVKNANVVAACNTQSLTNHHERTYIHMTKRDGAHDEDYDMLVIGSGLGGRVAALQLTKKKNRTRLLAVGGRSPDRHFAETSWDIKRFAWAPLGLKGTRRIFWLPKVMVHAGVGVVGCSRVLQRMWKSRSSTNCDCTASTDSESLPGPSRPLHPRVAPWRLPTRLQSVCGGVDQDVRIADRDDHFVNRCWRSILSKQSRCLPLLSAGLGCLRRAMRWRAAASSTAADQERSPSHSLAGLPWHEFIRRVAAAEADAERAAIGGAHFSSLRLPFVIGIPSRTNSSGRADESSGGRHS